jgi:hypothetical protein
MAQHCYDPLDPASFHPAATRIERAHGIEDDSR